MSKIIKIEEDLLLSMLLDSFMLGTKKNKKSLDELISKFKELIKE